KIEPDDDRGEVSIVDIDSDKGEVAEFMIREELEESLTKLLDYLQLPYTPELIESLVDLVIERQLNDDVDELEDEPEDEREASEAQQRGRVVYTAARRFAIVLRTIKEALAHVA